MRFAGLLFMAKRHLVRGDDAAHLMRSPGNAGTSSSWLTAHRARRKTMTASPLSPTERVYTFSMASRPAGACDVAL